MMLPGIGVFLGTSIVPGSETYSTPGTYTFTVPSAYNILTIQVYGAGGGGGYYYKSGGNSYYANGTNGGTTYVTTSLGNVQATGGQGGIADAVNALGGSGSGPTGTVAITGGTSPYVSSNNTVVGGNGAGPGAGTGGSGVAPGNAPGGGGGGVVTLSPGGNVRYVSGGGGGGYASLATSSFVGLTLTVVVGSKGTSSYGASIYGADGRVVISWT